MFLVSKIKKWFSEKNLLCNLTLSLANGAAHAGAKQCFFAIIDEPKCPKSLIK